MRRPTSSATARRAGPRSLPVAARSWSSAASPSASPASSPASVWPSAATWRRL